MKKEGQMARGREGQNGNKETRLERERKGKMAIEKSKNDNGSKFTDDNGGEETTQQRRARENLGVRERKKMNRRGWFS